MKTNDSLVGGRFKDDPRVYDAYARYFVRFVQDYRRAGVPIGAVTLQNAPQNRNPSGYPGMDLRDDEEARLVVAVGRAFQRARIHTTTTSTSTSARAVRPSRTRCRRARRRRSCCRAARRA
jgi:glucosylceramidase